MKKSYYCVLILLSESILFLQSCMNFGCYDIWYNSYPIAYGEGVIWTCENEEIGFQASFETMQIQYGHYGKGMLTYQDISEEYQLMFVQDKVYLVYPKYKTFNIYFGGSAKFSETCLKINVEKVDDDRFSALLGSELSFFRTDYKVENTTQ